MSRLQRHGNALVIVLALALLLMAQLYIVSTLSSGNVKHLGRVTAHIRAAMVAESAFSHILARIKGAPWSDRWFKSAPAVENDVPLVGGTYSSFVSTVPTTSDHLADVWIRGKFDGSAAVMYWRVKVIEDTLDFSARVYPQFFTHLPGDGARPTGAPGDPTTAVVETMMGKQKVNRPRTIDTLRQLDPVLDLPGVIARLGVPAPTGPLDIRTDVTPALPQPIYIADVKLPANFPPLPASPPPPLIVPPASERSEEGEHRRRSADEENNDNGQHGERGESEGDDRDEEGEH